MFQPDDPVWVDPDRQSLSSTPANRPLSTYYDYLENAAGKPGQKGEHAMNINTLGEVPRSSWYTPRHFYDPMSKAALRQGPNQNNPPDTASVWRVVGGKAQGKAVGFQIVDGEGDRYLLKFDPKGHIELATGAEAVSTRLFYALGYHVPQNYVVRFRRNRLKSAPEATYETSTGDEKPITPTVIDRFLGQVPQYSDGSYRALASLFIEGTPLGPFKYFGTRPDDPNDIFPHEMRRELRGLRVFAAWVNHDDSRSANTFTALVEEDGRRYVRHYLLDFGTTFGGGPGGPKPLWPGQEQILEPEPILLSTVTLGLAGRPWRAAEVPDLPAIGTFDAEYFDPTTWRPQYYNPAFQNMDADDAFWAAKQVAHFTREELRVIVESGQYTTPATVDYLTETLAARRNKIARAYLPHGGGLGRFQVTDGALAFEDFLEHPAFEGRYADATTTVTWHRFDNQTGHRTKALDTTAAADGRVPLPDAQASYVVAVFRRPDVGPGTTEVFLRRTGDARRVVGIRRSADGVPSTPPTWTVIPKDVRSPSSPAPQNPAPASPSGR
ncbi:MAG: hypothetical protein ABEL97_15635 [Salinibacter sp.]